MIEDRCALVFDDEQATLGDVALRLLRLRVSVFYAKGRDEAWLLANQERGRIHAMVFSSRLDVEALADVQQCLQVPGMPPPRLVVMGERPDPQQRARLRSLGVDSAAWGPQDDTALQFVVNASLVLPADVVPRDELRVPAARMAEVRIGGTRVEALTHTLSAGGAFLELPTPPPPEIETVGLEIWLPEGSIETRAQVVYVNPQKDRRRAGMPIGMGVSFDKLDPEQEALVRRYVAERSERFTL